MDTSIGARVGAKGAGALSAVRGRIAKVKLRGYALGAVRIGSVLCSYATAEEERPTAREVIGAIQEQVGVPWKRESGDTFKEGNLGRRWRGSAGTMKAALHV